MSSHGDRPEMGSVGLELLRQPVVFARGSHSFVAVRHDSDELNP